MPPRRKFARLNRRGLGRASRQTDGTTGRKKLARSATVKRSALLGRKPNPPSKAQRRFGERITELREKIGMARAELAQRCKIEPLRMGRIEAGEVSVCLPTIFHLAEQLGVRSHELFLDIDAAE